VQIANGGGPRNEMRATRRTQKRPEGEAWPGGYKYIDGPKEGQSVEECWGGHPDIDRGEFCKPWYDFGTI